MDVDLGTALDARARVGVCARARGFNVSIARRGRCGRRRGGEDEGARTGVRETDCPRDWLLFERGAQAKMLKCAGNDDAITMKADDTGDVVTFMFESPGA